LGIVAKGGELIERRGCSTPCAWSSLTRARPGSPTDAPWRRLLGPV